MPRAGLLYAPARIEEARDVWVFRMLLAQHHLAAELMVHAYLCDKGQGRVTTGRASRPT